MNDTGADGAEPGEAGRSRRFGARCWLGWAMAAIFCATTAWLAHHAAWVQRQSDAREGNAAQLRMKLDQANELVTLLTSPKAQHVVLTATGPARRPAGQVSWMASRGALVFVASGLRALSGGKMYEMWMVPVQGKTPLAAGLFRPDAQGNATVEMPPLPANTEATSFLVTVEAAGGTAGPSGSVVMRGR